jgi:hypothetical protein
MVTLSVDAHDEEEAADKPDAARCPICWETGMSFTTLFPCKHAFCKMCVTRQMYFDARCALCRAAMRECRPSIVAVATRSTIVRQLRQLGACHPSLDNSDRAHQREVENWWGFSLIEDDETLLVVHIDPKGKACAAGIREGDTIIAVNGFPCVSMFCATQIMHASHNKLTLHLRRDSSGVRPRRATFMCCARFVQAAKRAMLYAAPHHNT